LATEVNVENIKESTGATIIGDLIGKKINIMAGENKGRAVLRIASEPVPVVLLGNELRLGLCNKSGA
jgi:ribosomal protein S28E/S33